jgi:hypothetical protein
MASLTVYNCNPMYCFFIAKREDGLIIAPAASSEAD